MKFMPEGFLKLPKSRLHNTFLHLSHKTLFSMATSVRSYISIAENEVSVLDPPDHLFRIRLVCVVLETCGQYFDKGSSKRKLDCFLVYFQVQFMYNLSALSCISCFSQLCHLLKQLQGSLLSPSIHPFFPPSFLPSIHPTFYSSVHLSFPPSFHLSITLFNWVALAYDICIL